MMFPQACIISVFAFIASALAVTHTVIVGNSNGDTIYTPPFLNADPGDTLVFQFQQKNHSVVQSSFRDPCTFNGGINSGFFPVPADKTSDFPTFSVPVKDRFPLWFYCAQNANLPNSHCGAGMVFAANPGNRFPAFKTRALAVGARLRAAAGNPSQTPTAPGVRHTIVVGNRNGDTIYTPETVDANPGDELVFQFQQKNHSAVQSSFEDPCTFRGGFNSGFFPVPPGQSDNFQTFTVPVKDRNPIWVYCAQNAGLANSHCGAGMVFAANPGFRFGAFKAKALAVGARLRLRPSPTAAAPGATHTVVVGNGNGDTIYTPPFLDAEVGDKVLFVFQQKNHSVVQSSFGDPCTFNGGFNSGL
ncbi:hypothetical protein BXZ70DRAFT_164155 [Cristinia sonorae]|uniref:Cupredoxin n=1 Tax=Cristinia sonorae TaxID=1940300 RepID=A0A8K0UQR2_9AGAR|nr:hypothetical protein BXZ70DRAFT_164155 [Cristinia sonorae]